MQKRRYFGVLIAVLSSLFCVKRHGKWSCAYRFPLNRREAIFLCLNEEVIV
ncbi:hypothetical protein B4090_4734 [Bacillus licheniformis]|nr:hypothetical protein B4090_4734 [Bacillus licheniformis]TWN13961.1 hypothetical protein CHCC14562_3473 [Bacillus licheniformis]TWN17789.1 hypothetical protein CHCC14564_2354 [Bacillus licheniformis LMG 17339]TWN23071.1 hypothetical protein CHCC14559_3388 [Bacillus licheniformis]